MMLRGVNICSSVVARSAWHHRGASARASWCAPNGPSMSHVFTAPAIASIPVAGSAGETFPVHRIYCVGRNYVEHAIEMGFTGREPPFFFLKPADAVLYVAEGQIGRMPYPSLTKSLHHEVELVVAIGSRRRDLKAAAELQP